MWKYKTINDPTTFIEYAIKVQKYTAPSADVFRSFVNHGNFLSNFRMIISMSCSSDIAEVTENVIILRNS